MRSGRTQRTGQATEVTAQTTLPEMLWPLMHGPTVRLDHCAICGRTYPLEQHHYVRRNSGELYVDGERIKKPTITLCGFGNCLQDASGRYYCHGLAHANRLHFAFDGVLWYAIFDEPINYLDALDKGEWKELR